MSKYHFHFDRQGVFVVVVVHLIQRLISDNSCTIYSTLALYRTGSYKPVLLRSTKERRSVVLFLLNFDGGFVIHVQVHTSVQPSFCNTLKL